MKAMQRLPPLLLLALAALTLQQAEILPRPAAWASPADDFRRAGELLANDPAAAANAAIAGLERAPWYGPGWLLWARATAIWLGPEAALPLYAEARRLDPLGRGVATEAVPILLRAGAEPVTAALHTLLRHPNRALAAALPEPSSAVFADPVPGERQLTAEVAHALRAARRDDWLAAFELWATPPDPVVRRYSLAAACRLGLPDCIARAEACRHRESGCRQGLTADPEWVRTLTAALRAQGADAAALATARSILELDPAEADIRWLAAELEAGGETLEAARLLRLHPAMPRTP